VLKAINHEHGNWTFRKLHLFHPEARSLQTPNKRFRRNLRRQHARAVVPDLSVNSPNSTGSKRAGAGSTGCSWLHAPESLTNFNVVAGGDK
jgi:hypothetical protein